MRVKATEKCFVDNSIRQAGEVFEYTGDLYPFMELIDEVNTDRQALAADPERRKPGRPRKSQSISGEDLPL